MSSLKTTDKSSLVRKSLVLGNDLTRISMPDAVAPLKPPTSDEMRSMMSNAIAWDTTLGMDQLKTGIKNRLETSTMPQITNLNEARTNLIAVHEANEAIIQEAAETFGIFKEKSPIEKIVVTMHQWWSDRYEPEIEIVEGAIREAYPPLAGRFPNVIMCREKAMRLMHESAGAALKPQYLKDAGLTLLLETLPLLPIAHNLITVSHLQLKDKQVDPVAVVIAIMLAFMTHEAVKGSLKPILLMWYPIPDELKQYKLGHDGSKTFIILKTILVAVVIAAILFCWIQSDISYMARLTGDDGTKLIPAAVIPAMASFGVILSFGTMLGGSINHVKGAQAKLIAEFQKRGAIGRLKEALSRLPENHRAVVRLQKNFLVLHLHALDEVSRLRNIGLTLATDAPTPDKAREMLRDLID